MDGFEKSLLACIVAISVMTAAMIDWFPYSLIGILVITVLAVVTVHAPDWLQAARKRLTEEVASLKAAKVELDAIEQRVAAGADLLAQINANTPGTKEFNDPVAVVHRCDAQDVALRKGDTHYGLYGAFPPPSDYRILAALIGTAANRPPSCEFPPQSRCPASTPRRDAARDQSSVTAAAEAP